MSIRTLLTVLLLSPAAAALAATGMPNSAPAPHAKSGVTGAAAASTKETLSSVFDINGNGLSAPLPQYTLTTVAESTIKCNHLHGCSFGLEAMGQVQTGGGDWAICLEVDGNSVSCQYQGVQSGPSSFVVGNARGWASGLADGNHTVTMQLFAEGAGATYQYFQLDTSVYKP